MPGRVGKDLRRITNKPQSTSLVEVPLSRNLLPDVFLVLERSLDRLQHVAAAAHRAAIVTPKECVMRLLQVARCCAQCRRQVGIERWHLKKGDARKACVL